MRAAAEAILFAAGEPVEISRIAQALNIETEDAVMVLQSCAEQLDERESGVCLLRMGERYQLCTRQEYADQIRSVLEMKRNAPLSSAKNAAFVLSTSNLVRFTRFWNAPFMMRSVFLPLISSGSPFVLISNQLSS